MQTATPKTVRLTARQKRALEVIDSTVDAVLVVEKNWLIYLSEDHTCPFGLGNWHREKPQISDVGLVRKLYHRLPEATVKEYIAKRNMEAKWAADAAIEAIRTGNYLSAQELCRKADDLKIEEDADLELYECKRK